MSQSSVRAQFSGLPAGVAAILAFCISLILYVSSLLPGVGGYGDTSKFQFIGASWGLPHPPGFPTYIFLNFIFSRLPFGTLAWRINLMSAVFGSLAVSLLCLTITRISRDAIASLWASLTLAVSFTFWSTCLVAEVYTLAFFFIIATIYCVVVWRETMRRSWFYLACLLYSISLGNHLMVIALIPPLLYIVIVTDRGIFRSPRALAAVALIILLGAAQYLYIPLRTIQGTSYVEGAAGSFRDLIWFATGGVFRKHYFAPTMRQLWNSFIPAYARVLVNQLTVIGVGLAAAGIVFLFRRERVWACFFFLLYIITAALYIQGPHIEQTIYFVPATMALSVSLAFSFKAFTGRGGLARRTSLSLILWALPVFLALKNFPLENLSGKTEYDLTANLILESVKPQSIILSPGYHWTEILLYKLIGERSRAGDGVFVLHQWAPDRLKEYQSGNVDIWDPYLPKLSHPQTFNLYLLSLEPEPRALNRIRKEGWRTVPVIAREHPLVNELRSLEKDKLLLASVRDEGTTILEVEARDALRAIGLKTRETEGDSFGWAAAYAVVRRGGNWIGWKAFRFRPVAISAGKGAIIPGTSEPCPADINIACSGYGRGSANLIAVAGRVVSDKAHGLNLVVMDMKSGKVEKLHHVPPADFGSLRSVYLYELVHAGD